MAEDIDIIALWDKGKQLGNSPEIDIDKAIRSKSKGTLYWIRIILTIEFCINIAALPLFFYFFIIQEKDYLWGGLAVVITIVYLFYYQFLIKQIKGFSLEENVRTSLKKLYGYLRFFLLHYKVVIWVSLSFGLLKAFIEDVPQQSTPEQMAKPMFWVVSIAVSIFLASIAGGIMHLMVHLIYGRKIKRLKKMVKEFSS